jgi:O-antigen/teichoic acid export membrane protein
VGVLARQSIGSAIFIALGFLVGSITNLFLFPYMCPKEELGQYKLFFNWAMIFSQFIAVGAGTIAVKYLFDFRLRKEESKLSYFTIYFPLYGIGFFTFLFVPFSIYFVHSITEELYVDVIMAVFTIWIFTVTQTFIKSFSGLAIALNRSQNNFFISEFLTRLIVIIAFLAYYYHWVDYTGLFVLLIISYIIQLVLIIYSVRDFITTHGISKPQRKDLKQKFTFGIYSLLDSGANAVVTRLDVIMIGFLSLQANKNAQEYDLAISIATIIFLPWRSLSTTSGPFISEAFVSNDIERIHSLYKRISTSLFLTGGIIFVMIYSSIDDLIKIIPGDYSVIKFPVLFLGIAKLIDMLASINNVILLLSPYYKYNLIFNIILIIITILTNYILIPIIGITGSAIATAITIFLFNVFKGIFLFNKYKIHPFSLATLNCMIGIGIIFCAGLYFPSFTHYAVPDILIRTGFIGILFLIYFFIFKPSHDLMGAWIKIRKRFYK